MPTKFPDLFAALAAPFEAHEIKERSQAGRKLHYITARTAMNRFDSVLGPESWTDRLVMLSDNSFLCEITITLPDGKAITKCDVGGMAGMSDAGDDDKSGASDAFKRAAVKFGVGRYLYRDGVPYFAREGEATAPPAPAPAPEPPRSTSRGGRNPGRDRDAVPRSGKQLYAWAKDQEEAHGVGMIRYLQEWGKRQDYPNRMVEWNEGECLNAHAEGARKLASKLAAEPALAN